MRIDKYLKNSRLIKRRTVASDACSKGRVLINDKVAKPGTSVKIGDVITLMFATNETKVRVTSIDDNIRKEDATSCYELLS